MVRATGTKTGFLAAVMLLLGAMQTSAANAPQLWVPGPNLAQGRWGHTATLLGNGKVLVTGGVNQRSAFFPAPPSTILASAELYDPAKNTWLPAGNMSVPREGHTATLLPSGKVLAVGGRLDDANAVLSSAQLYNPATNSWSPTGSLLEARAFHTETLLPDGRVLVTGGRTSAGTPTTSAEIYNPVTGTWVATAALGTPRSEHTASLLADGKVLVVGGRGPDFLPFLIEPYYQPVASAEVYNPANNSWTPRASMVDPRFRHTQTTLPSGKVLVAGGSCAFVGLCFGPLDSAVVFDPANNVWTDTGPMVDFIQGHAATLLRNGLVLVTGRSEAFGADSVYDPATNQWTGIGRPRLDALPPLRNEHTATLLGNGRILIAGGKDRGLNGLASSLLLSLPTTNLPPVVVSNESEDSAMAIFQSFDEQTCVSSFVFVKGGILRSVESPPGARPNTPVPTLILSLSRFNECFEIGTNAEAVQFDVQFKTNPLLTTASLTGTATMFDFTLSTIFTVTIHLEWTGYGELLRQAGGHGFPDLGAGHGNSAIRLARARGTVADDTTNYTPEPSLDDPLFVESTTISRVRVGGTFFNF